MIQTLDTKRLLNCNNSNLSHCKIHFVVEVPLLRVGVTHEPQHFTGLALIGIVKNLLWFIKGRILIHVAKAQPISNAGSFGWTMGGCWVGRLLKLPKCGISCKGKQETGMQVF